jgi:hypothetical protein
MRTRTVERTTVAGAAGSSCLTPPLPKAGASTARRCPSWGHSTPRRVRRTGIDDPFLYESAGQKVQPDMPPGVRQVFRR